MSHAQPLSLAQPTPVRPTAVAHHVSPNRPASIPKRKGCLACVSTNTCICVQNPFGEELGAILRARELRQMLGAMTTDDLIRVAAKKRYAVVPINALSSQRQFPAAMGGSAIGSRSARPTGWQLNSAQRREVIGSESTESLIGGESEASSAPPQWTTASEAESEAEEQQQPNGGGFVRRMSEWMGHLFGRGKILKRKQDAVREFEDTTEPQEGPEGYGREKRVRRD
ncbi:hypothetical protein BG005_001821 [Podila minutissima]|nr:hypothetical protein BG005_001821 [Podila minutissima]